MSSDPEATPPDANTAAGDLSEEEMRAAYEAELAQIRVDDVLVQTVVSLLNLGARRAGLTAQSPGEEPDFGQVRTAIEATRALLPLVETELGADAKQVRDALSQLQLAYTRSGAKPAAAGPAAEPAGAAGAAHDPSQDSPAKPEDSESAVSSGRLWVPGR